MSARPLSLVRAFVRLPTHALLLLITLYQRTLSPALPVLFGPSFGCRFSPTCSHYAADAVRERGALVGAALAVVRLLKCTPLHPGGHDPVPPRRPVCRRSSPTLRLPLSPAFPLACTAPDAPPSFTTFS